MASSSSPPPMTFAEEIMLATAAKKDPPDDQKKAAHPNKKTLGITTFISKKLRRGVRGYDRKWRKGKRYLSPTKGKKIGRIIDCEFQRYLKGKQCKSTRLRSVLNALKINRIRGLRPQLGVADYSIGGGITTQLDGLGVIPKSKTVVVIELKTTQNTLQEHKLEYTQPSIKYPKMRNGCVNSEQTSHFIQTGFGMRALKKTFDIKYAVEGIVIVSCADMKSAFYRVPQHFQDDAIYRLKREPDRIVPVKDARDSPGTIEDKMEKWASVLAEYGTIISFKLSKDVEVGTATFEGKKVIKFALARTKGTRALKVALARLCRIKSKNGPKGTVRVGVMVPQGGNKQCVFRLRG